MTGVAQLTVDEVTRRRVVLIIGASSGIGRSTARALAGQGWNVVLASRSATALAAVQQECELFGIETLVLTTDVGDGAAVDALFAAAAARFGRIDAVLNTAAAVAYGRFEDVPAEIYDRVITTNLLGTANVARAALRQFQRQGGGELVLTGSLLGKIAVPFMSPYVTSKWGVHALTRMIQIEARQTPGVHVTLISPGSVNTPAYSQAANYASREGRPPPPIDPPEKVARAIVKSLTKPARERSVGIANPIVVLGFRLLPAVFDLAVTPLMKLGGLSRRPLAAYPGTVLAPNPEGEAEHGFWGRFGRRTVQTGAVSPADPPTPGSTSVADPEPAEQQPAGSNPSRPAAAGHPA
jgi:NAD(P)-dependent dehydrogenase (short-subunit alcohol dehydrogenase family)